MMKAFVLGFAVLFAGATASLGLTGAKPAQLWPERARNRRQLR